MPAGYSPAGGGGSYASAGTQGENIYRSTTVSGGPVVSTGLLDGMKKAFGLIGGKDEKLLEKVGAGRGSIVISSR